MAYDNSVPFSFTKNGIFYFERRVPADLRRHYETGKIAYSLRTRSTKIAATRARRAADQLDEYWYFLRSKDAELPGKHRLRMAGSVRIAAAQEPPTDAVTLSEAVSIYLKLKGKDRPVTFHRAAERSCGYVIDVAGDKDLRAWAVLKFLYPEADVPVFQVSIDMSQDLDYQLSVDRALSELRDRGVLILGSGNVVHNLRAMRPGGAPQDFALEFDTLFADRLSDRDFAALTSREKLGSLLAATHPTVDHYLPARTIAGASREGDDLTFMTDAIDLGSVSMRSFVFHAA